MIWKIAEGAFRRYLGAMPELPEVETVCRGLAPVLEGRRLTRVVAYRPDIRVPLPPDLGQRLTGRTVQAVERRSKYMLWRLDDDQVLIVHLGMSGSMRVYAPKAPPLGAHDHVEFVTDQGAVIRFNDPRRFGLIVLSDRDSLANHPLLAEIGPEPLDPSFDGPALAARLKGRNGPIKAALMNQKIVAGLGNIYVCESLFRAGISPRRRAATVQGGRALRLIAAIQNVLKEAIAAGGSSLRDHRQTTGELGYFSHSFAVYDREGEACPGCTCDLAANGGIRRIVQTGRSTFYCPQRQR
jgi:formamidopyrimidine-DNA glycosylase